LVYLNGRMATSITCRGVVNVYKVWANPQEMWSVCYFHYKALLSIIVYKSYIVLDNFIYLPLQRHDPHILLLSSIYGHHFTMAMPNISSCIIIVFMVQILTFL
jgi:hypothetical protein